LLNKGPQASLSCRILRGNPQPIGFHSSKMTEFE
jgi:hypothetical protein